MKKDTSLDPLRPREDLQKLVADLEGKGKEAGAGFPRAGGVDSLPSGVMGWWPRWRARPNHSGKRGLTKFCTPTERTRSTC
jgi:hypothetical protein